MRSPPTVPSPRGPNPAPPVTIPEVGDVVLDRYVVEDTLGQGGMGVILAARHLELGHRFAIKLLQPQAHGSDATARFLREARIAVQLRSEHAVRVSDVGTLPSGMPYMVMELLQGSDLSEVVRNKAPIPIDEAVGFVLQACEVLAEAHSMGVVHRDLKPGNLFLTHRYDGTPLVKVLDFGISKLRAGPSEVAEASLTVSSAFLGSPLYASPEQLSSTKDVDARADIWALGVVLFELLTKEPPFEGETFPVLCANILHGEPCTLRRKRPDAPLELENAIARCLQRDPNQRFGSIAELAAALREFASPDTRVSADRIWRAHRAESSSSFASAEVAATTAPSPVDRSRTTAGLTASTTLKHKRPRGRWWLLGGLSLFAIAGGSAWLARPSAQESVQGEPTASAPTPSAATPTPPPKTVDPLVVPAADVEPADSAESTALDEPPDAAMARPQRGPTKGPARAPTVQAKRPPAPAPPGGHAAPTATAAATKAPPTATEVDPLDLRK